MTYAYLEKLNRKSLLETTSSSLGIYNYASSNTEKMGTDGMSTAERIQFYQRLKELRAKGDLPKEFNKSIDTLETGFSKIEITMQSTDEKGEVVYLRDMSGNRVTLKQLIDNPDATYKWECDGDGESTTYFTTGKKGSPNLNPKNPKISNDSDTSATTAEGVSRDSSSGCSNNQTFEASGKTILNSSLFSLNYSANLFK